MGRALFVLVLVLVGCVHRSSDATAEPDPGWTWDPPAGGSSGYCRSNADCERSAVCARNSSCVAVDQVRAIHVSWTVSGAAASQASCAAAPELVIHFESSSDGALSFAPVPCFAGRFTVDRLPRSFDRVGLGRDSGGGRSEARIDAVTGEATLDLPY